MNRIYVDQDTGKIERTDLYLVRLTLKDGTVYEDLEPRMLFPLTNHTMFISLLDQKEKEIGFVRDLEAIDESSRKALEECFREFYMIPRITKVISCEEAFGALKWTVDTDRGRITFQIRNRHSDIKTLRENHRILIKDSNDNRYEIVDYTKLDKKSIRLLYSYL